MRISVKINNRKILTGIAEIIGEADKIVDITVAIDKLDKIGLDNVNAELASKGIPQEAIDKLQPIILLSGSNEEKLETLKTVLATSETGMKGVEESEFILKTVASLGVKSEVETGLDVGSRIKLLYRCYLRGEGTGCTDWQHQRWRYVMTT